MSAGIVRLAENEYVEWSSVCDAPRTWVMSREAALSRFRRDRIDRADTNGHSWLDMGPMAPEEAVRFNRAGPDEETLTLAAIRRRYASPEANSEPLSPDDVAPCDDCGTAHHLWGDCPTPDDPKEA